MIFETQPYGLKPRDLQAIGEQLQEGNTGIIPTDSVYAFCCLANKKAAFESICSLKHIDPKDALMSIVCKDLRQASEYFLQLPTPVFRVLNKNLPGPFTFILQSGHRAPAFLKNKRKTLGLRIPDHRVVRSLMDHLDYPLIVSSVRTTEMANSEYFTDAEELIRNYENRVGFIVVDDNSVQEASTVIDMTGAEPLIVRQTRHELQS